MFARKLKVIVFLMLCHLAGWSFAQNGLPRIERTKSLYLVIDSIITEKMEVYQIPGLAVGVIKGDEVLFSTGYGFTNIESQKRVDQQTAFHTASVSKLLTAQTVLHLFQEQNLSLDTKLSVLLPDLNYSDPLTEKITVRQLLNHTSGLPDIRNYQWKQHHQSDQRLEDYVTHLKLTANGEPGTAYEYSNLGYNILAYLVQKRSGLAYEDYVLQSIMRPAGMRVSDFRYFRLPKDNRASPHSRKSISKKVYVRKTYPYSREHSGSSTLNASLEDLNQWMIHFLKELKNGRYVEMIEPSFESYPFIGLGFQLDEHEGYRKAGHYGGDIGFRSYVFLIPEKELGFALLANCDYNEDFRQEILHPIASFLISELNNTE